MGRKASERKRVRLIEKSLAELRAEREVLLAALNGCDDRECTCHRDTHNALREVEFLLGFDEEPAPRPHWWEDE